MSQLSADVQRFDGPLPLRVTIRDPKTEWQFPPIYEVSKQDPSFAVSTEN